MMNQTYTVWGILTYLLDNHDRGEVSVVVNPLGDYITRIMPEAVAPLINIQRGYDGCYIFLKDVDKIRLYLTVVDL